MSFKDCFQNDAFRILADVLCCRNDFDSIVLEYLFIKGGVVTASREPVKLIDEDVAEGMALALVYHPLERRPFVGPSGEGLVDVGIDDVVAFPFGFAFE